MLRKILSIVLVVGISIPVASEACTIWASIGRVNAVPGLLLVKNRDADVHGLETMKFYQPVNGYKYLALVYNHHLTQHEYPYISAGINERGLAVVNNAASTVATHHRDEHESATMRTLLTHYATVADVLKDQKKLFTNSYVNNLLIGDRQQIADIEIAPDGKYHIFKPQHGILYHSNEYHAKNLLSYNKRKFPDSLVRYHTIQNLLTHHQGKYKFRYYLNLINRQMYGTNASLFREWTLASWIIQLPVNPRDNGILYVRFTSPQQKYHVYRFKLNKHFWQQPLVSHAVKYKRVID